MKRLLPVLLLFACAFAHAAETAELPRWFTETFLDFAEDARDAAREGKRVMLYLGQEGCPYCRELIETNFRQKRIVEKTRRGFVAIALNVWGDREVTWEGRAYTEKTFAAHLKVQFTPTVLFLDERSRVVARINGYYPPHRFEAVLDYVAGRMEDRIALAEYLRKVAPRPAGASLNEAPFLMKPPYDLRRRGERPLAVLFETRHCADCDRMHREGFRRREVEALLARFDVARFDLSERAAVVTPAGEQTTAARWVQSLGIAYTPSIVLFAADGAQALRVEAYVRPFHLASALDYVASGAFRREPSFQRFLQERAAAMRERGEAVELWK